MKTSTAIVVFGVVIATGFIIGFVDGCAPKPAPAVAPDAADSVYQRLVAAGCLAPSADGVDSIAQAHAMPDASPWLNCLFAGGSVVACNTPCR